MLDLTKEYRVEQKPTMGDPSGLDKEGLSRHVGTMKGYGVAYNDLTKKYRTGLDEFAPEVQNLPKEEYDKKVNWILNTRKTLEEQIGNKGILSATNGDFWDVWRVDFEVGQDKKVKVMGSHPMFKPGVYWAHKLALITLEANDDIPMSKKESSEPKYRNSQFYVTTTEEETTFSKESVRKTRQRAVEMNNLFGENGKGFERAFNIAYLMNVQKEKNIGIEKLEEVLEAFTPQPEYLDKFLTLCKAEDADIQRAVVIKKAIAYDIIKYNPTDQIHYKGGINFRKTEDDTVEYFKVNEATPDIAREFMEITEAVRKRDSKQKKA